MTFNKPKIFIGSSSQGYSIAEKVKVNLGSIADCYLWKEPNIWIPMRSTFENLQRMVSYFDFGVFVATGDDWTKTNDKVVLEPRDNVILELALFLGAMGRDKSFLLVEEDVKLPSDFNGIFMPRFKRDDDLSIKNACEEYIGLIEQFYSSGYINLYPTTSLAIGYYKNFVNGLVTSAHEADILEFDGIKYSDFKLKIVLPSDLKGFIKEKGDNFYRRHGFVENALKTRFRKHPAWFQLDPNNAPTALLYDMPTTLTGIEEAIVLILNQGFCGRTKMQEVIEQRELNNFRRVLQFQIDTSPYAQETVEIIDEF
jgi:hypothetical protein